ncbi:hypothetical protein [Nonomuraea endophytica]|uniref:Uncharacterized protein n=1 Tax=Nonomuraea endophytica TaxID=714136 RepID=A0A7W8ABS4_9ACTN|nr:hypothetical protein [Nonomuraea endophytica]MBB5082295.1 hypothetical protein [Nonomuraea endophytica]
MRVGDFSVANSGAISGVRGQLGGGHPALGMAAEGQAHDSTVGDGVIAVLAHLARVPNTAVVPADLQPSDPSAVIAAERARLVDLVNQRTREQQER